MLKAKVCELCMQRRQMANKIYSDILIQQTQGQLHSWNKQRVIVYHILGLILDLELRSLHNIEQFLTMQP